MPEKIVPPVLSCVRDTFDERDYKYEDVMGAAPPDMPSILAGYDVEVRFGPLPDHPQGSAYDCVGEGSSQDHNMSIKIVTGRDVVLSARDIYSQIFIGSGGSSPREAYKLANKVGVVEDKFLPTRPNGQVLTEEFARKRDDLLPGATYWKIGPYYSITTGGIQAMAQAIFVNHGCGGAYFPDSGAMGHFIFFRGYGMYNGYKAMLYRDSYSPFKKWLYQDGRGDWFLQDGTPVDLAGIWTAEPGDWPPYQKKEVTEEMLRIVWLNSPDLQKEFPGPAFLSSNGYWRGQWAMDNYEDFIIRYKKFSQLSSEKPKTLIQTLWDFLKGLFL